LAGKEIKVESIEKVLTPAIADLGFELIFTEIGRVGSRLVLRLFIDKTGGVAISDCEKVSREVEPLLDAEDFFPTEYALEVSSPGVDRPLRGSDFAKYVGQRARVELKLQRENRRKIAGVIERAEGEQVTLILEKSQRFTIELSEIKKANLIWDGTSPSTPTGSPEEPTEL
jgi:ribosome maturation factor RimP